MSSLIDQFRAKRKEIDSSEKESPSYTAPTDGPTEDLYIPLKKRKALELSHLSNVAGTALALATRKEREEAERAAQAAAAAAAQAEANKSLVDIALELKKARGGREETKEEKEAQEEQQLLNHLTADRAPLMGVRQNAKGIVYTDSMETGWRPPRKIRALTDSEKDRLRKKWHIDVSGEDIPAPIKTFKDMRFPPSIRRALDSKGITKPTPIQIQGIPVVLSGRDMIGIAFTGSGKCWGEGTELLMYDGSVKKVEAIRPYDELMGDDSTPRVVQPNSLTSAEAELYEIQPVEQRDLNAFTTWRCNAEHILVLRWYQPPTDVTYNGHEWSYSRFEMNATGDEVEYRTHSFTDESTAREHHTIAMSEWRILETTVPLNVFIHWSKVVQQAAYMYQPTMTSFQPSITSLTSRINALTQTPSHASSSELVTSMAWAIGMWMSTREDRSTDVGVADSNLLTSLLSSYHLLDQLHIPSDLIRDSLTVRRSLMAGLLDGGSRYDSDSNSYIIAREVIDSFNSESLARFARGLGLRCIQTEGEVNQLAIGCMDAIDMLPMKFHKPAMSRKTADPSHSIENDSDRRYNFTITPVGVGRYFGFALDGNHRCLLSDYVVTHNTLTFSLPMVMFAWRAEMTLPLIRGEGPTGMICCPSRELARQTYEVVETFSEHLVKDGFKKLNCMLCIGGVSMGEQLSLLNNGLHMVVATPGRLLDFLNKKKFTADICKYICLDEADRLIDLGFEEDIRQIFDHFRYQRQTVLFSATMPSRIQEFALSALVRPVVVNVGRAGAANLDVIQEVEYVKREAKVVYLLEVLQKTAPPTLIFASNQSEVDDIHEYLLLKGIDAVAIHGGLEQSTRVKAIQEFKNGTKDVLVATDVASKGLDFPDIQHVINFDLPQEIEDYVHRIGRTGRCWAPGTLVMNFDGSVTPVEHVAPGQRLMGDDGGERVVRPGSFVNGVGAMYRVVPHNKTGQQEYSVNADHTLVLTWSRRPDIVKEECAGETPIITIRSFHRSDEKVVFGAVQTFPYGTSTAPYATEAIARAAAVASLPAHQAALDALVVEMTVSQFLACSRDVREYAEQFSIPTKSPKNQMPPSESRRISPCRFGFSIHEREPGPFVGFAVDGPNARVLLADGTVSHNCGKTGIATTFINRECNETTLLDLKHLLREAKQKIPPVLMSLEDPIAESRTGAKDLKAGCSFCGGLGHSVLDCPKLRSINKAKQKNSYGYDNIEESM